MNHLRYGPPSANQIPTIAALDRRCLGGLWSEEGYRRELSSPNSALRIIAMGQMVIGLGCFWAIMDEAHITLLGINPSYQRRGLGQWLLWNLLWEACQWPLRYATLEVRLSNAVAQKLYCTFGFQVVGRRRRYYSDDEDALILWRNDLHQPIFRAELLHRQARILSNLSQQGWQLESQNISLNRT